MAIGEPGPGRRLEVPLAPGGRTRGDVGEPPLGRLVETVVSPFHCLYGDALHFHSQGRLALLRSEAEAARLSRAALLLYLASAEALVHQAAAELGRPELAAIVADPSRPLPTIDAWRLLPSILGAGGSGGIDPAVPPWPQFAELLGLRDSWAYPGLPEERRAYYRSGLNGAFEPLGAHEVARGSGAVADRVVFPRTGLPRDPYALRPAHLDTARSVLDAAIEAIDRRLDGALTREQRHRREPTRFLGP